MLIFVHFGLPYLCVHLSLFCLLVSFEEVYLSDSLDFISSVVGAFQNFLESVFTLV